MESDHAKALDDHDTPVASTSTPKITEHQGDDVTMKDAHHEEGTGQGQRIGTGKGKERATNALEWYKLFGIPRFCFKVVQAVWKSLRCLGSKGLTNRRKQVDKCHCKWKKQDSRVVEARRV